VTAEKRSAKPLAHVAENLLGALSQFPEVFFAKLVQREGGWAVPAIIPPMDVDGQQWTSDETRTKVQGYRDSGSGGTTTTRFGVCWGIHFADDGDDASVF
jgi:nucleoporin GLE1